MSKNAKTTEEEKKDGQTTTDNNLKVAEDAKKSKLSTQQVILILGIVVIVAAAIVVILLLRDTTSSTDIPSTLPPGAGLVINDENVRDIMEDIHASVERGMFITHMNTIWSFRDGTSPSHDAVMGNSSSNNFPFYFTVTLAGTDEVVFTSGLLPLGTQIEEITLDTELPAGTYDAVVNINMVDDDGNPVDANMGISITIIIES
jgi:hypothetical protein